MKNIVSRLVERVLRARTLTPKAPRVRLRLEELEPRTVLDVSSAGAGGIVMNELGLTGNGINLGQVDPNRPGSVNAVPGGDPESDDAELIHPDVNPYAVFRRDGPAIINQDIAYYDYHATSVAGVIIARRSESFPEEGIAKDAFLYASATDTLRPRPIGEARRRDHDAVVRSIQHVAMQAEDDVVAINVSMGWDAQGNSNNLDAASLAAIGADYLSDQHSVLLVQGKGNKVGPEDRRRSPGLILSDSYNSIVIGSATRGAGETFDAVSEDTDLLLGANDRRLIHLLAPGENIRVPMFAEAGYDERSGTSIAAPHVTGAVALIHEAVENEIAEWNPELAAIERMSVQRPEVMKAILMNSADKLERRTRR